ncbi:hypothetical protein ACFL08_03315 [Patescibacteria group bacterium]
MRNTLIVAIAMLVSGLLLTGGVAFSRINNPTITHRDDLNGSNTISYTLDTREFFEVYDVYGDIITRTMRNKKIPGNLVIEYYEKRQKTRQDVLYPDGVIFQEYYDGELDVIQRVFIYSDKKIIEKYRRDRITSKKTKHSNGLGECIYYKRGKRVREEIRFVNGDVKYIYYKFGKKHHGKIRYHNGRTMYFKYNKRGKEMMHRPGEYEDRRQDNHSRSRGRHNKNPHHRRR